MSIYAQLTEARLNSVLRQFYERVFADPMLMHFFLNHDHEKLLTSQTDFVRAMLGGPQRYQGMAIIKAHEGMQIRPPHMRRRQMILREVLVEQGIEEELAQAWLHAEARLVSLILSSHDACNAP